MCVWQSSKSSIFDDKEAKKQSGIQTHTSKKTIDMKLKKKAIIQTYKQQYTKQNMEY